MEIYMKLKSDLEYVNKPVTAETIKEKLPEFKPMKVLKGDKVDELFAFHLAKHRCALKVTRIATGKYMFGTRQILAKIVAGKLVIRVGGGYMGADEFILQYGEVELMKFMTA